MKVIKKLEKMQQTSLGEIPMDWELAQIGDISEIKVGRDLRERNFSALKKDQFIHPVFSNTVENEGLYGYYNFEEYKGNSLTVVGRGAGLGTAFSRTGGYGAIGRLIILFPNNEVSSVFLSFYINSKVRFFIESGGTIRFSKVDLFISGTVLTKVWVLK